MSQRAENGGRRGPARVPGPNLTAYATEVGVGKARHRELGEMARIEVQAGTLTVQVLFPVEFANGIGKELLALRGPVIATPDQMPKEPPK